MNKLLYLLLIIICCGCAYNSETEKHQYQRDNIINIRDKLISLQLWEIRECITKIIFYGNACF
jgi:hypothetical protein